MRRTPPIDPRAVLRILHRIAAGLLFVGGAAGGEADRPALADPGAIRVSLVGTLRPSAIRDVAAGHVEVRGTAPDAAAVLLLVTTSRGVAAMARAPVRDGAFSRRYPADFPGAPPLAPGMLFIDATAGDDFRPDLPGRFQAEAALILHDPGRGLLPDLPSAFTNDLLDAAGHTDDRSAEWPVVRALVNLCMRSRGARMAGFGRSGFDLADPASLRWFKDNLTLYEFDGRDRDWSAPLGARVRRTFWQAVWDSWFNSTNDHPQDGNDGNRAPSNYVPYTFANDFADVLIAYILKGGAAGPLDDNLPAILGEGIENLLAMQHREAWNFALPDGRGKRESYGAGAFRYGLFEDGEILTEGKGWFHNPEFLDYAGGGVFNGRAVWALGEALKANPRRPLAARLREAIALSVKYCLHDAIEAGYAKRTRPDGPAYWRDAGEHGYLLAGMLAACSVAPEMPVQSPGGGTVELRAACASALAALLELEGPERRFAVYPNVDAFAVIALADGADVLKGHPDAPRWLEAAARVARAWMEARVDAREHAGPAVHFGLRIAPGRMTFNWRRLSDRCADRNVIHFYISGHWIHALARLHALTGDGDFRDRAEAVVRYLCGDNPWSARLLTETGGVYNWVEDADGDGVEDALKRDLYPESTAFCQIGILHLLRALGRSTAAR
jgi:hypothetical protein